ncbi:unnamed protein product, partial [Amoebophrya sp. A120]|eukprot:GSA120T00024895001.1
MNGHWRPDPAGRPLQPPRALPGQQSSLQSGGAQPSTSSYHQPQQFGEPNNTGRADAAGEVSRNLYGPTKVYQAADFLSQGPQQPLP